MLMLTLGHCAVTARKWEVLMRLDEYAIGSAVVLLVSVSAQAVTLSGWPEYLRGVKHQSYTSSDVITPSNVGTLHRIWHFKPPPSTLAGQPPPQVFASPT